MSGSLDSHRPAACRHVSDLWPHADPASFRALERDALSSGGNPFSYLDRSHRRGFDGQPAARWIIVRSIDFTALRTKLNLWRRSGWSGGGFLGPFRDPLPNPLRAYPDRWGC